MINDTITLDNTASLFGSYLTTPLANCNQIFKIADADRRSNAFMSLEKIHIALDSTEPNYELSITAIGQQYTEKFKSKCTISQACLKNSILSAEDFIDKLCQDNIKKMRVELAKHAYYDTFNISIYLNHDIIGSLLIDNADIDSEIYWVYE